MPTRSGDSGSRKGDPVLVRPSPRSTKGARPEPVKVAIRVAVAIRPKLSQDSLCKALDADVELDVAAASPTEKDLAAQLTRSRPDVLLLDRDAVGRSPESVVLRLHRAHPTVRILVLSGHSDAGTVERTLRAGASGLLDKDSDLGTLGRAIRSVARGEVWAERRITAQTLQHLTDSTSPLAATDGDLTPREVEIVDWVGRGLRNREIADRLQINEKTVKTHLNNIFRKLRVDTRVELALRDQSRLGPKA